MENIKELNYAELRQLLLKECRNMMGHFDMTLDLIERDHVIMHMLISEANRNPYGGLHGGAYFTMSDICSGITAMTDGRRYVTQDASCQFLNGKMNGTVAAEGTVLKRGRKTCTVQVRIYDEEDKLLYNSVVTMFCITE